MVRVFPLAARLRLKKKPAEEACKETQTQCPICSEKLVGTSEELNGHVEMCLKKVGRCLMGPHREF